MVLTDKVFQRPTYDDLLTRQENRAKTLFGEDIDTSSQSILGKYIRLNVEDLAECYELLEEIYYAIFPGSARGQSLDRRCVFAGITRNPATAASLKVRVYGNTGAIVPAAFMLVGNGKEFYVGVDYTVGGEGYADCYANCTEPGTGGNLTVGTEITIVNPDPDLERAELLAVDTYGEDRETDTALRIRYKKAVAGSGSATANAIRGALSRIAQVDGVAIAENDTESTVDGRPPHSFECYVFAPESQDQEIGEAIFSKKPIGIRSVGTVEVQVLDDGNKPHTVRFSRTKKKIVYIKMKVLTNQFFENDGVAQIRESLLEYINNLANGDSVYLSSLYGYIHDVHGVVNVQELSISTDGETFSMANIIIEDYEMARCEADDIEVEVVS